MKKKLNITFCSFPDFSSNAKPLYEYMKKRYKNTMNFAWIVRTDEVYSYLKKKKIDVYKLGSEQYFKYIKTSDVIFSTHADITGDKPKNSLYIELWHGIGPKPVGFLSENLSESDYNWYKHIKRKIDYFIVPSGFWKIIFSSLFNVESNRVLNLGYPKFDSYKDKNSFKKLEKVLKCDLNKYKKIIFYMPIFRNGCNRECESTVNTNNVFNVDVYDEKKLISYLDKNDYLLCIKKHPSELIDIHGIDTDNIKIITDEMLSLLSISISEILNASDVMITDYSSLGVEYLILDKPVIYLINDVEEYMVNRGIIFNDYNFWMPGRKVSNIKDLLNSIDYYFSSDYSFDDIYSEKKRLWIGNLNDGGCDRICDFFFDNNCIKKEIVYYKDNEEFLEEQVKDLKNIVNEKDYQLLIAKKQIDIIVNSKGWIFLESLRRIKRKLFRK